jgi:hypothetical protein
MPLGARLALIAVFAFAGWQHARHIERKYGRQAYGTASWVWGILTGISLLLGIIALAAAESRLRKEAAAAVPAAVTTDA